MRSHLTFGGLPISKHPVEFQRQLPRGAGVECDHLIDLADLGCSRRLDILHKDAGVQERVKAGRLGAGDSGIWEVGAEVVFGVDSDRVASGRQIQDVAPVGEAFGRMDQRLSLPGLDPGAIDRQIAIQVAHSASQAAVVKAAQVGKGRQGGAAQNRGNRAC